MVYGLVLPRDDETIRIVLTNPRGVPKRLNAKSMSMWWSAVLSVYSHVPESGEDAAKVNQLSDLSAESRIAESKKEQLS